MKQYPLPNENSSFQKKNLPFYNGQTSYHSTHLDFKTETSFVSSFESKIKSKINVILEKLNTHEVKINSLESKIEKQNTQIEEIKFESDKQKEGDMIDLNKAKEQILYLREEIEKLKFKETLNRVKFQKQESEKTFDQLKHEISHELKVKCAKLENKWKKQYQSKLIKFEEQLQAFFSQQSRKKQILLSKENQRKVKEKREKGTVQQFYRKSKNMKVVEDSTEASHTNKTKNILRDIDEQYLSSRMCSFQDEEKSNTIYYVDSQGYILDENHHYLLDNQNKPIMMTKQNKKYMEFVELVEENEEEEISFNLD